MAKQPKHLDGFMRIISVTSGPIKCQSKLWNFKAIRAIVLTSIYWGNGSS